jgi:sugar lactone lactonase YvrE
MACRAAFGGDDGPALEARFAMPVGQAADPAGRIVFDEAGNLYFADSRNHRIRRIGADGVVTTVAGSGQPGYAGDGGPATAARIHTPVDVELGPEGALYFTDTRNSCIRRVRTDGVIETVAGRCGERGDSGDGGPATQALLDRPYGIGFDREGQLYIADTNNNRLRKVQLR